MPLITQITPSKRAVIGKWPCDILYTLKGSTDTSGAYSASTLLSNFNSEWSALQSGGTWVGAVDDFNSAQGTYIGQTETGTYSRYITSGTNWPRHLDATFFFRTESGRYVNFFFCVKDVNNYYRIEVDRSSTNPDFTGTHTVRLYKKISGIESLVTSNSFPFTWNQTYWIRAQLVLIENRIVFFLGAGSYETGYARLNTTDSSLSGGSIGIGSVDGPLRFKGPYIHTPTNEIGRIWKLDFNRYVQPQATDAGAYNPNFITTITDSTNDPKYGITAIKNTASTGSSWLWLRAHHNPIWNLCKVQVSDSANERILLFDDAGSVKNFTIFCRLYSNGTNISGFVVDYQNPGNFIKIVANNAHTWIDKVQDGVVTRLATASGIGRYNDEFNEFLISIDSTTVTIVRNGIQVYSGTPSTWRVWPNGGKVGMYAESGSLALAVDEYEIHDNSSRTVMDGTAVMSDIAESLRQRSTTSLTSTKSVGERGYVFLPAVYQDVTSRVSTLKSTIKALSQRAGIKKTDSKSISERAIVRSSQTKGVSQRTSLFAQKTSSIGERSAVQRSYTQDASSKSKVSITFSQFISSHSDVKKTIITQARATWNGPIWGSFSWGEGDIPYDLLMGASIFTPTFAFTNSRSCINISDLTAIVAMKAAVKIQNMGSVNIRAVTQQVMERAVSQRSFTVISNYSTTIKTASAILTPHFSNLKMAVDILKTIVTRKRNLWGQMVWDGSFTWGGAGDVPYDLLTMSSIQLAYSKAVTMRAATKIQRILSVQERARIKRAIYNGTNERGRIWTQVSGFLINDSGLLSGEYTNSPYQYFYVDELLDLDGAIAGYYTVVSRSPNEDISFPAVPNWDGKNNDPFIFGDGSPSQQGTWYLTAWAIGHHGEKLGRDVFALNIDTINPVVAGAHIVNLPVIENHNVTIRANSILWDSTPKGIVFTIRKNGVIYKQHFIENPDPTTREYTFVSNSFNINDKLDVRVGIYDRAWNYAEDWSGFNYGGDEVGNPASAYQVKQRYVYQLAFFEGTLTESQMNGYYCPNYDVELVRSWDCPISEAGILFAVNMHKDCPYCRFPLITADFNPKKNVFESNFRPNTPVRFDKNDLLAILKVGVNYGFQYQPQGWLYNLEVRDTPYGQDVINLGSYSDIIFGTEDTVLHVEMQISEDSSFGSSYIIHSRDTFSDPYDFLFKDESGIWQVFPSSGLSTTSGQLRYSLPIKLEPGNQYFFRWRLVESRDGGRNYREWNPQPSSYSSFTISKFNDPTQTWDGNYREHILEDNWGFNGFYQEPFNGFIVEASSVVKSDFESAYKFTRHHSTGRVIVGASASPENKNAILQVKVRSNQECFIYPFSLNASSYKDFNTQGQTIAGDEQWHILKFNLFYEDWFDGSGLDAVGIVTYLNNNSNYIEIDYIALLPQFPQNRKKYFYPHIRSNVMPCMYEQKHMSADIYNSDGFCTKGHRSGFAWKGIWNATTQYQRGDEVVRQLNGINYHFVVHLNASSDPQVGSDPLYDSNWTQVGTLDPPYTGRSDGLYKGGSRIQNPDTTGFCRNTSCPDYKAHSIIDEHIEIIFDPQATIASQNISFADLDGGASLLVCPNNKINLATNTPECQNNFMRVAIPPARKVCSRNEGARINNSYFDYRCTRFSVPAYDGSPYSNAISSFDTSGSLASNSPGNTKIPADNINGNWERKRPKLHYWEYDDKINRCDGILRDNGQTCGSALIGYSEAQLCPECNTPLIPFNESNFAIRAMRCSNFNRSLKTIPKCNMAQSAIVQSLEDTYCAESGDLLVPFNHTAILIKTSPTRSINLTGSELRLVADGNPKTYAFRGWDPVLNVPYTGQIGGSSGSFAYGDRWQGVTSFRRLYATDTEVAKWTTEKEIMKNLSTRLTGEVIGLQNKKNALIAAQYARNIEHGDIESLTVRPGPFVESVPIKINRDNFHLEYAEFTSDSKIKLNRGLLTFDPFFRSKAAFSPNLSPSFSGSWEYRFKLRILRNSSVPSGTVAAHFGLGRNFAYNGFRHFREFHKEPAQENLINIGISGWSNPSGIGHGYNITAGVWDQQSGYAPSAVTLLSIWFDEPADKTYDISIKITPSQVIVTATDLTFNHINSTSFPISQSAMKIAPEYCLYGTAVTNHHTYWVSDVKIIAPQAHESLSVDEKYRNNQAFIDRNLMIKEAGFEPCDEHDQMFFNLNFDGGGLDSEDKWTETYYLIEIDPLPTFDSRRGGPMRRVFTKGWWCLNKAHSRADGTTSFIGKSSDGLVGGRFCRFYKYVWSDAEAKELRYKCPSCEQQMFRARLDSSVLSLMAGGTTDKTVINPDFVYQLIADELPGLHNSDYLMIDADKDGKQDHEVMCDLIPNKFFKNYSSIDNNQIFDLPTGWTEDKCARKVNDPDRWSKVHEGDLRWYFNRVCSDSLYIPAIDMPKSGNILVQTIKTQEDFNPRITRFNGEGPRDYIVSAKFSVSTVGWNDTRFKSEFSDIRWSLYLPTGGHDWSAYEAALDGAGNPYNSSYKLAYVEFELIGSGGVYINSFTYFLSNTQYDYFDYIGKPYAQIDTTWWKWLRPNDGRDHRDEWQYFKQNVYEDVKAAFVADMPNMSWESVHEVRMRLGTLLRRDQTDTGYAQRDHTNGGHDPSNFAMVIWGDFQQGWTSLTESDGSKLLVNPKVWDGIYYYRVTPYSIKLNPQWLAWNKKVITGFGHNSGITSWQTERGVDLHGIPHTKWMYKIGEVLKTGQIKYGFSWKAVYDKDDHVVLPEGYKL